MIEDSYIILDQERSFYRSADRLLKKAFNLSRRKSRTVILLSENIYGSEIQLPVALTHLPFTVMADHGIFSSLEDPNKYNFRFAGRYARELALFEFFDSDRTDAFILKKETRALFEDSLLLFYTGQYVRALGGFSNVLKIFPGDDLARYFSALSENLLAETDRSDI